MKRSRLQERFQASIKIDDKVIGGIEDCVDLAPLHNPANLRYDVCGTTLFSRPGVADVHFTPGVPFNLALTVKASF